MKFILITLLGMSTIFSGMAQDSSVIHLWPGAVPGSTAPKHAAAVTEDHSGGIVRITDVTDPTLTVFRPRQNANGAAVIVCPGGGYYILAIDLEGYEIAHWLNKMGITAFVLEYRVPKQQAGALQDVQRAVRLVRHRASEWGVDPDRVGVMGFSAGGSLSARISTEYSKDSYAAVDEADSESSRPSFALLVYPAYLDQGPDSTLTPELTVTAQTPPMFIFQTADDRLANSSLIMAGALRKAGVPVEMHLYPKGGHGYGLRPGNPAGEAWPPLAEAWLSPIISATR
jgi:acetyl esterase/lipase